jgi:hypothetical protein
MQNRENFILLGVNTIIIILVLIMLFRMQDNKIKLYLKKSEKKLDTYIQNQIKMSNSQLTLQRQQLMNVNTMPIQPQILQDNHNITHGINHNDNKHENIPDNIQNNIQDNIQDNKNNMNDMNDMNDDIDSYIDPMNE